MQAKREFRDREATEVAVLDALVDHREGMTVFELRSHAEVGIDELEDALSALKDDGLIETETDDGRTNIVPSEQVIPEPDESDHEKSLFDRLRERFGL
jgi:DNA-binding transcriptional ArsR family regulator